MSKKFDKELMQLDLYELLGLSIEAEDKEIKKCYRKKALQCHPDKNPDNPKAAVEFDKLKKILEILLDPGARSAYDKVLKSRKAAAIRAREANSKSQKLKSELEKREQAAAINLKSRPTITEEEKFRRELKRLEEEGEKLIEEELEKLNREVELSFKKSYREETPPRAELIDSFKVKVKWTSTDDWPGYTKDEIQQLFYKWGEINAVVVQQKGTKGTALIEYKTQSGADMAVSYETGMIGKPVEVSHSKPPEPKKPKISVAPSLKTSKDYESVVMMNRRRELERKKLIEEMLKNDS